MTCFDRDEGKNAEIVYQLEGDNSAMLEIDASTGRIVTSQTLSETIEQNTAKFNISVLASDLGKYLFITYIEKYYITLGR